MVGLVVFLCLITMINLLCYIYCRYMDGKSSFVRHMVEDKEGFIESVVSCCGGTADKSIHKGKPNLKKRIIIGIRNWMSSFVALALKVISYLPSHALRNYLYKNVFRVKMGKKAVLHYGAEIRAPWNLFIDEGAIIGDCAILDARSGIYIGRNANLSTGVWIWTLQHDVNSKDFGVAGQNKPVIIKDRAWVSCRTVLLPGVIVEEGTIISAGAVMTKTTDPFKIYGGIPGKVIGDRKADLDYTFDGHHRLFL